MLAQAWLSAAFLIPRDHACTGLLYAQAQPQRTFNLMSRRIHSHVAVHCSASGCVCLSHLYFQGSFDEEGQG